jgi:hypothetical protein
METGICPVCGKGDELRLFLKVKAERDGTKRLLIRDSGIEVQKR